MVGRKPVPRTRSRTTRSAGDYGGDVYEDMLAEAGVAGGETVERPLKRRRAGKRDYAMESQRDEGQASGGDLTPGAKAVSQSDEAHQESDEDDVEFEDVAIPKPTVQTMELDSDESSDDDDDLQFEDVDLSVHFEDTQSTSEPHDLELNLTAQKATTPNKHAPRRKPITREERERRVDIHKVHLLCLLSHVARRNHWCNDAVVQEALRPHLTDKMVQYLTPGTNLSQFGRTESLKNGLKMAMDMWRVKFEVTERGLRRSLWAEDVETLQGYQLPDDAESCLDRGDFREAAKKMQGSRDVGAQLFCTLLRGVGVRARLACSLQPLSFVSGGPVLPKVKKKSSRSVRNEQVLAQITRHRDLLEAESSASPSARRRLGHPNAMAYRFEPTPTPPKPGPTFDAPRRIRESLHPVYWVEVLDVGHQKWQPVDAMVTRTFWKPRVLEPPLTDGENCLCYVVAFDGDHTAKDVTRRYAKAYTAKTLNLRIEKGVGDGGKWWRRVMRMYRPRRASDVDQIEDNELTGLEAREPMPRNVQDFKDHPVYALERHLRRHEVLLPGAQPSGTVSAGARAPLEKVYRRRDVRIARSAEKWFRMGREVKPLETPVKYLKRPKDQTPDAGTSVYTMEQTEIYEPPPIRHGKVPKNKFGNVEVYTPSMVPGGGVHLTDEHAARAACILGIDYAPALTAFRFEGRQGVAVLRGVVVAREFEEAMRAVVRGLEGMREEEEGDRRRYVALKGWRRLLMGLRIRERVWRGVGEEERREAERVAELGAEGDVDIEENKDREGEESEEAEEFDMLEDEDGGGFLID